MYVGVSQCQVWLIPGVSQYLVSHMSINIWCQYQVWSISSISQYPVSGSSWCQSISCGQHQVCLVSGVSQLISISGASPLPILSLSHVGAIQHNTEWQLRVQRLWCISGKPGAATGEYQQPSKYRSTRETPHCWNQQCRVCWHVRAGFNCRKPLIVTSLLLTINICLAVNLLYQPKQALIATCSRLDSKHSNREIFPINAHLH